MLLSWILTLVRTVGVCDINLDGWMSLSTPHPRLNGYLSAQVPILS